MRSDTYTIVFTTIVFMGIVTSAWSSSSNAKA